MKIVSNTIRTILKSSTALGFLLMVGPWMASAAYAADGAGATPAIAPPSPTVPAAPDIVASSTETPASLPMAPAATSTGGSSKNLAPLEDKVTDSVKNVVKQFGSIENVNLEDLNMARQAVVKLEVLIDIEKHLAELDKIRSERNGSKNLSSVLPASALGLPAPMSSTSSFMSKSGTDQMGFMPAPVVPRNEITRIIGADGHYTAVMQGKNYRVGDNLPDGSTIMSISAKTVETKLKDGAIHMIHVKGVDTVYGHTL